MVRGVNIFLHPVRIQYPSSMKTKVFKTLGISLLTIALIAWAVPFIFKATITRIVKARIQKDLSAQVSYSDVNISWFRAFPQISVGFNNLQVLGIGEFEGDTLLTVKQFDLACNAAGMIPGDSLRVYSVVLNEPRFHALVHSNGQHNWNILKTDAADAFTGSAEKSLKWTLQQYAIHNGYFQYEDESRDIHFEMEGLEQEAKGNFSTGLFVLKTNTTAETVHFNSGGAMPYRLSAKAKIEASLRVDPKTNSFTFNTDRIYLNGLQLHAQGYLQRINDSSYNMNISYKTPSTEEFKNLLSLLSPVYERDVANQKSGGQVIFNGYVIGKYDSKQDPSYHMYLNVENGSFQHPDLTVPVKNFNLAMVLDNPDGLPDHRLINIRKGHIEFNTDSLDFHLLMKNPQTKPFIDLAMAGNLDLSNISNLMKLQSGTRLSGLLSANLYAKGYTIASEKKSGNHFKAGGHFGLHDFLYLSKDYPEGVVLTELLMELNPKNTQISEMRGGYLSTHFNATGTFHNLFDFAVSNHPLEASLDVKADGINLRDIMGGTMDSAGKLVHVQNVSAFVVPAGIHFTMKAQADKLHYDNLDMQNLSGNLSISDETIHFSQVKADALEGKVILSGTYSTKYGRENPEIAMTYDVNGADVQKTYLAFNTVQKLLPVGRFVSGKFNASMTMTGRLLNDMSPDLHTMHGEGNILLTEGVLKDFGPLDKLSQSLDVKGLKNLPLKDVKTDFTFESGKVVVNAFQVKSGDIGMEIFGTHSLDQSIEYGMNLIVPRSQLGHK